MKLDNRKWGDGETMTIAWQDHATEERQRRISQSQPLVVNWPAVIGCALLILSAWGVVELCKLL